MSRYLKRSPGSPNVEAVPAMLPALEGMVDNREQSYFIETLIKFFEDNRWTIYRGGYPDEEKDEVIAERKDYDVATVNITKLAQALKR